jgi:hypothetical protein
VITPINRAHHVTAISRVAEISVMTKTGNEMASQPGFDPAIME